MQNTFPLQKDSAYYSNIESGYLETYCSTVSFSFSVNAAYRH